MQVLVRDNNVDQALKALKKKMQREGIFREMKLRGHYEKPSERRAREKAEAVRRARKLARKKMQREGLLPMKPKPRARRALKSGRMCEGRAAPRRQLRRAPCYFCACYFGDSALANGRKSTAVIRGPNVAALELPSSAGIVASADGPARPRHRLFRRQPLRRFGRFD